MSLAAVAAGLALHVPVLEFALVALAYASPVPAVAVSALVAIVARRREAAAPPSSEVLRDLSASLRAGLSLRGALVAAGAGRIGERAVRLARLGAPLDEVAASMRFVPVELASLVGLAGRLGGSLADALDVLATEEDRASEDRREVRASAAPMLLQAAVVGGLPLVAILYRAIDGSLVADLTGGGPVAATALVGVALVGAGLWWLFTLVRRALR